MRNEPYPANENEGKHPPGKCFPWGVAGYWVTLRKKLVPRRFVTHLIDTNELDFLRHSLE
jgi:hypothetical protein